MAKVKVLIKFALTGAVECEVDEDKLRDFEAQDACPVDESDLESALGVRLDSRDMSDAVDQVEIVDVERVRAVRFKKKKKTE